MTNPSSGFLANVLKLVTGSIVAQAVAILVTPIVTRLFAPEPFGIAALFTSIVTVISVVSCLRYELAIMLPKTDEEAANILSVSVCSVVIISAVTALFFFLAGDVIANALNAPKLKIYLWMLPLAVLSKGLFLAFNFWDSRMKRFGQLSFVRVVSSLTTQTTKVGAGFAGHVSGGVLIGTNVLGYVVSASMLGGQIWRDNHQLLKGNIRWKNMLEEVVRYKEFPIYSTWAILLETTSHQLAPLFLAIFFSSGVVGFFALGLRVLSFPIRLIGQAIGQVFFQKAAEVQHKGQLNEVVKEVFQRMISLGMFPFLLLALLGKDLFSFVFGSQWAEAGVYIQMLSLWIFFVFILTPLSNLFSVLEVQKEGFYCNLSLFLSRAISLSIGGILGSPRLAIALFSVVGTVGSSWMCLWILYKAKVSVTTSTAILARYLLLSLPFLGIIGGGHYLLELHVLYTLGMSVLCSIFYYGVVIYQDVHIRTQLFILLEKKLSGRKDLT